MEQLLQTCQRLARIPTAVPLGPDTLMEPDDPLLVPYVQQVLRGEFDRRGVERLVDAPRNQLIAELGDGGGPSLLVMAYTPTQHNNLMADPWSGRIAVPRDRGVDEPCIFGQGVSQNKVHQAVLLDVAEWSLTRPLHGTLWLAINNEGRSSHDCTEAILDSLPHPPDFAVLLFPTGFRISVGNRGRVDVVVDVHGRACHSSRPGDGASAIDGAAAAMARIDGVNRRLRDRTHGDPVGGEHAVVYQVTFHPVAPHTLPGRARLVVDRRLVAGSDPDTAVDELRAALVDLDPYAVTVQRGVTMLPADLVADDLGDRPAAALASLERAATTVLGRSAERYRYPGTFDAGGLTNRGVPAVMFGAAGEGDLLGDDFVRVSALRQEAQVMRSLVDDYLAKQPRTV